MQEIDTTIFKNSPNVRLAFVFGSSVRKTKKAPRDIDIALLLDERLSAEQMFEIREEVTYRLEKLLRKKVDVVLLNRAGPVLRHQVAKYGKLLFEREPQLSCAYKFFALRDYEDCLPLQRFYVHALDKKLGV